MNADSSHIDIFSFAYETTPDASIGAGVVPAPATLLVGSLAFAGLRRRRSSAGALAGPVASASLSRSACDASDH